MQIRRILVVLSVIAVPMLGGCANIPIWSDDETSEVARGDAIHKRILEYTPEYGDKKLSDYVSAVGNKLAAVSDRPSLKWTFTILDSPVENAFATRGGHVYITRGLLIYLRDESDLAAVLAHEIAHICRRDSIRAGRRTEVAAIGLLVMVPEVLLFPPVAAPVGMGLAALNRADETGADRLGATYLTRAGYRAEAMQKAMDILVNIEAYKKSTGRAADSWWHRSLAHHPTTAKRQERLSEVTDTPLSTEARTAVDLQFLARLDGIEVGNSAEEGILHKGKRYFPDLDISLDVPTGWRARSWRRRDTGTSNMWMISEGGKATILIEKRSSERASELCNEMDAVFENTTLQDVTPLHPGDTRSCTAVGSKIVGTIFFSKSYWERVGIIRLADGGYLTFRGRTNIQKKNEDAFAPLDQTFLAVARSIEVRAPDTEAPDRPRLRIHRARAGDSFETLAQTSTLPIDSVPFLRAINVRSPEGEVAVGDVVKIVK